MVLNDKELRRLQLIEVDMLKEIIRICDELDLRYYVLGGTLLGAVRHNGFLPWDDDIDLGLPREDYTVFIQKAPRMLSDNLFLQHHRTDEGYCMNMVKIRNVHTTFVETHSRMQNIRHGVFIDIFPLDNAPISAVAKLYFRVMNKLLGMRIGEAYEWVPRTPLRGWLKKCAYRALSCIWPDVPCAVAAREKLLCSFPNRGMIGNLCGAWGIKEIMPAEWHAEGCSLDFEGIAVKAPIQYEKWLTQVYGDYMTLPPEEKRVTHHDTVRIDLDIPYMDYVISGEIACPQEGK